LIDPATGQSRASRLIAATAVARTAARAEVATKAALMADAGHELDAFDALGCDGFVIDHDGDVFRSAGMSAFESMVAA
jgi:thiamine biosynthesis lipoprotein ApbE